MRFRFGSSLKRLIDSVLVYRPADFAFAVEPDLGGFTSIMVNDLSLEIDDTGKLIYVWGYCPHVAWVRSTIVPPRADRLEVFAVSDDPFLPGVSHRVNPSRRWPVLVDQQSGWVSLNSGSTATSFAEVLSGVVIGLDNQQQLSAVYLKPKRLPQL